MSSLRYRRVFVGDDTDGLLSPRTPGDEGGGFRIARDPAVDQTTPLGFASVGLADNPDPPVPLGPQTSPINWGTGSRRTPAGRPGCWQTDVFRPGSRGSNGELDLNSPQVPEGRGTLAPGTIRRNVQYVKNGIPGPGFFSWAANKLGFALGFEPARDPQDEYVVSSLFLGLADSLATVVSGSVKPAPGLEPFRAGETVQAQASTGWPVLAPQIPSFGSRVPLRRPRGLVTTETGG